jgi:hypothetical protein
LFEGKDVDHLQNTSRCGLDKSEACEINMIYTFSVFVQIHLDGDCNCPFKKKETAIVHVCIEFGRISGIQLSKSVIPSPS